METVRLLDGQMVVEFSWESVFAYLGYRNIIAAALMTRLFARAFRGLCPDAPPDRDELSVLVAFPGTGIREAVELITRLATRHPDRFVIDPTAGPGSAPAAPIGRFYFEIGLGTVRSAYMVSPNVMDNTFRDMVLRYDGRDLDQTEDAAYRSFKTGKVQEILTCSDDELFVSLGVGPHCN
ncbi:MAG: hypothetical protein PF508_01375 [Spirochaeta sp.]|jgi:hypothetical protein|nr:hypothetical protein [Spirochaeta sp.]